MAIELEINGAPGASRRYISYASSPCRIRLRPPVASPANISLSSRPAQSGGGELVFYPTRGQPSAETLDLTLPADGSWVSFEIGGKFGSPSVNDRDCLLVVNGLGSELTIALMVRVRKNANNLTIDERDRFLEALFQLNLAGTGTYQDFRNIHVDAADLEAHRGPQFLPWHRAFLLDLERELQVIDPTVSLPYWRFDQPAPRIFQADFMGATTRVPPGALARLAVFNDTNPLAAWATDGMPGIRRSAIFDTATSSAPGPDGRLRSQDATLALGTVYQLFARMEGSPHGSAHLSFSGSISSIPTAVKDPLFFLLHANVDRLWALWQWNNQRTDPQQIEVYTPQNRDGRRLTDTMWPWNGVITPPRPNFAPGGQLPGSPTTSSPGARPRVQDMIDFQGHESASARLGYGYDDVPFEFD
jgi:tyrosinase